MATHGTSRRWSENVQGSRSLCLLAFLILVGCAHRPPSPLAEATQAQLGTIGIVAAPVTPELDYRTPGRGGKGGAAIGAAKGLGLGAAGAVACVGTIGGCVDCVAGCALVLATPYLATRFAMDQAAKGVPADTIAAAETAIKAVLAEQKPQAMARDTLYGVAAARTGQLLVLLPAPGPATPSEAPRYRHLAAQGIDTVLEIAVRRIALRPQRATGGRSLLGSSATGFNPHLTLVVTTQRRVVRTADGTVLYNYAGEHTGRTAPFTDWGANDAQLLRDGLAQLFREIAGEIVSQVFGVAVPPANEPAAPVDPGKELESLQEGSSGGAESPSP